MSHRADLCRVDRGNLAVGRPASPLAEKFCLSLLRQTRSSTWHNLPSTPAICEQAVIFTAQPHRLRGIILPQRRCVEDTYHFGASLSERAYRHTIVAPKYRRTGGGIEKLDAVFAGQPHPYHGTTRNDVLDLVQWTPSSSDSQGRRVASPLPTARSGPLLTQVHLVGASQWGTIAGYLWWFSRKRL